MKNCGFFEAAPRCRHCGHSDDHAAGCSSDIPLSSQEAPGDEERVKMELSQDLQYQRLTEALRAAQEDLDQARINHHRSSQIQSAAVSQRDRLQRDLNDYLTKVRNAV